MRFKNLDLSIINIVVALNVAWIQIPNRLIPVGILLALPLILFLPGYTLTQTLFRRRGATQTPASASPSSHQTELKIGHPIGSSDQIVLSLGLSMAITELKIGHPIGSSDQIVLSLGLSMAIDVLVGFALNILPTGLTGLAWILSLGLITTVFALLAFFLRRKDALKTATKPRVRLTLQDCLLFGLAALVVASALWLAVIRPLQPQPSFTQFWMLPANQANKTCEVSLGVQNFATGSETYRIVMAVNHIQTNVWSSVALVPQQKWIQEIPIKAGITTSSNFYIEAHLYRTEQPGAVYRDVHLTFYTSSGNANGGVQRQCIFGA